MFITIAKDHFDDFVKVTRGIGRVAGVFYYLPASQDARVFAVAADGRVAVNTSGSYNVLDEAVVLAAFPYAQQLDSRAGINLPPFDV